MHIKDVKIGLEIVRSKGDYVVGRRGKVLEIEYATHRIRVKWDNLPRTWVTVDAIEDANIPYRINIERRKILVGRHKGDLKTYRTYIKL